MIPKIPNALGWLCTFLLVSSLASTALADVYEDSRTLFNQGKEQEAINMLFPLAESGDAEAQYILGIQLELGRYVHSNEEALRWYGLAAAQNHAKAQYNLGLMHYQGFGTEIDFTKAKTLFESAAKNGDPEGYYNIGVMYLQGTGVEKNQATAISYFIKAKEQGSENAINALRQIQP